MKRLFAALKIQPDEAFLDRFHMLQTRLKHERIKWVEDHNIHITLKFFGETEEHKIQEISTVMKKIADQTIPFIFSLRSLGIFGSRYDPRVVWVGITPYNDLALLMKNFQDECRSIGFEPDRQNLVPHLTIGRVKGLKDKIFFRNTIDQFRDISSSEMNAGIIFLYESILKKEGPVYLALNSFQLQKK